MNIELNSLSDFEKLKKYKTYRVVSKNEETYSIFKGVIDSCDIAFSNICSVDKRRNFRFGYWMLSKYFLSEIKVYELTNNDKKKLNLIG